MQFYLFPSTERQCLALSKPFCALLKSSMACLISAWVFITKGPCCATSSPSGRPAMMTRCPGAAPAHSTSNSSSSLKIFLHKYFPLLQLRAPGEHGGVVCRHLGVPAPHAARQDVHQASPPRRYLLPL